MSAYTLNGLPIISASVYEPRDGNWTADLEVDTAEDITAGSAVAMSLGDAAFAGSVYRGGLESGRWMGRIQGGSGGLLATLAPKNYALVTLSAVLSEIASGASQALASDSMDLSTYQVANWQRTAGAAAHAVQDIADELGVPWRITRAGELRLGQASFAELDSSQIEIVADPAIGSVVYAPDADPIIQPGVAIDGRPVSYVSTLLSAGQLRQEIYFDDSTKAVNGRIKGSLQAIIEAVVGRRLAYHALWPATVAAQVVGQLELVPDDAELKGLGLGNIRIRHGEPGYATEVPPGSRCLIGFEAGDPKRPYVAQWLANTSVTSITFENGIQDIARTNDTTSQGALTVSQPIPLGPVLFSYLDGIGSPAVAFSIAATNIALTPGPTTLSLDGIITSGNPKLKA